MPKYAQYEPTADFPRPVIGWFDTDAIQYAVLPNAVVEVSDNDWSARSAHAFWALQEDDSLVTFDPPVPEVTFEQQALVAISQGFAINLSGSTSLSTTLFPVDPDTQSKITAVITAVTATNSFPGGVSEYPMKDSNGDWHLFTVGQYTAVATAIATYVSALYLIADGNPFGATELPLASAYLVV